MLQLRVSDVTTNDNVFTNFNCTPHSHKFLPSQAKQVTGELQQGDAILKAKKILNRTETKLDVAQLPLHYPHTSFQ
jgi:hypothetical protein